MENVGKAPMDVPSFGDHLADDIPAERRFAHGIREWKQIPAITRREFVMVAAMNELTDKAGWQDGILDPSTVEGWRKEIMNTEPLMSDKAWQWCVSELRDKASYLKEQGFVRVLDTGSCVCKSDTLASEALCSALRSELGPVVIKGQHRVKAGEITAYIDPSMYPLVYGNTRVLTHGGRVSCSGEIECDGKSVVPTLHITPALLDKRAGREEVQSRMGASRRRPWEYVFAELSWPAMEAYLWSYKFQWLPSNVRFLDRSGTAVLLTSYINNLGNTDGKLYHCIEQLISSCIEPWNACMIKGRSGWNGQYAKLEGGGWEPPDNERRQRGRVPCRIITYGVEWENEAEEWMMHFDGIRRRKFAQYDKLRETLRELRQMTPARDADESKWTKFNARIGELESKIENHEMKNVERLPPPTPELWARAKEYLERPETGLDAKIELPDGWEKDVSTLMKKKITTLLRFKHPEPGTAFSYEEWKSGTHEGRAIVDMVTHRPIKPEVAPATTPHEIYDVCLQDEFRDKGLQVIIRVDGVDLSPEKPEFAGGTWTMEGQRNEHIVAMAILAYDVENVTPSSISFRQETDVGEAFFHHGYDLYTTRSDGGWVWHQPAHTKYKGGQMEKISEVFGFDPVQMCGDNFDYALPVQEIGKVALPRGRLVAFPSVLEYRREPFRLVDSAQPGHHRIITVMLVDPNCRLCSTGNVPPQQADWGKQGPERESMNDEEAEQFREEIQIEHAWMQYARYNFMGTFFFC